MYEALKKRTVRYSRLGTLPNPSTVSCAMRLCRKQSGPLQLAGVVDQGHIVGVLWPMNAGLVDMLEAVSLDTKNRMDIMQGSRDLVSKGHELTRIIRRKISTGA